MPADEWAKTQGNDLAEQLRVGPMIEGTITAQDLSANAVEIPPAPTDAIVDTWFSDTFPGSVVGRDVEVWNLVHAAKDDLKRRLREG